MRDHDKMTTVEIESMTFDNLRWPRWREQLLTLGFAIVAALAVWAMANHQDTVRLSSDTRVVVRFPKAVFAQLTQEVIREEFSIDEQTGSMVISGNAVAVGHVALEVQPDTFHDSEEHAVIAVKVTGETEKSLVGEQPSVRILGTGHGQFEAVKHIHFDGRHFSAPEATQVSATHETEIDDVETSIGGAVRLLASRRAREALPEVNQIAVDRIKERVGTRVDKMVKTVLAELNVLNQLDMAIARLHPSAKDWKIRVTSTEDYVQAALIPRGGTLPQLPGQDSSDVEVWVRLTPTQRLGVTLFSFTDRTYELLSRIVPKKQARELADEVELSDVGDWTRLSLQPEAVLAERA
jgi:hypothetical protein